MEWRLAPARIADGQGCGSVVRAREGSAGRSSVECDLRLAALGRTRRVDPLSLALEPGIDGGDVRVADLVGRESRHLHAALALVDFVLDLIQAQLRSANLGPILPSAFGP